MATSKKLPPNPFMHEILELVSKARTIEKKAQILKEYETDAIKALLLWNFDPTVISVVPDGDVPVIASAAPIICFKFWNSPGFFPLKISPSI